MGRESHNELRLGAPGFYSQGVDVFLLVCFQAMPLACLQLVAAMSKPWHTVWLAEEGVLPSPSHAKAGRKPWEEVAAMPDFNHRFLPVVLFVSLTLPPNTGVFLPCQ